MPSNYLTAFILQPIYINFFRYNSWCGIKKNLWFMHNFEKLLPYINEASCVIYSCITNYPKLCVLKQQFIISHCLWVRILCVTQLGTLFQDQSQAAFKAVVIRRLNWGRIYFHADSSHCWHDLVPYGWLDWGLLVPFINGIIC